MNRAHSHLLWQSCAPVVEAELSRIATNPAHLPDLPSQDLSKGQMVALLVLLACVFVAGMRP